MHTVCTLPQNVHAFDGDHSCVYVRIRSLPPWTDSWFLKIEFGILRNDLRFVYVRNKIVLMIKIRFNTKYPSSKFSRLKFTIFATICHIFPTDSESVTHVPNWRVFEWMVARKHTVCFKVDHFGSKRLVIFIKFAGFWTHFNGLEQNEWSKKE